MKEYINNNEEIENLYKSGINAPYKPLKDGYGYLGVLIINKKTGNVQCHICGNWFKSIGHHSIQKHKLTISNYKIKYGFPMHYPLCNVDLSLKQHNSALEKLKEGKIGGHFAKNNLIKGHKMLRKKHHISYAKLNSKAICPEQVYRRVLLLADKLEHFPTTTDFQKEEPSLLSLICNRYGSLNKFKQKFNFPILRKGKNVRTKDECIVSIRNCIDKIKQIPRIKDYEKLASKNSYVDSHTLIRHFGSWNKALHIAGIS